MNKIGVCIPIAAALVAAVTSTVAHANLASDTWNYKQQFGVITADAQYQNLSDCGGPSGTVQGGAFLDSDVCFGTLTQVIPTVAGQTYSVTFGGGIDVGTFLSPGIFAAAFDGTAHLASQELVESGPAVYTLAPADYLVNPPANCGFNNFCGLFLGDPNSGLSQGASATFTAVATGSSTTVELIESCLSCGIGTGGITVTPVPEPGTLPLLGFALGTILVSTVHRGRKREQRVTQRA